MKKNVPPVKEEKQNSEDKAPEAVPETQQEPAEPSIETLLSGIDPSKLEMAESFGVPIRGIIQYMSYQEQKSKALEKAIIQTQEYLVKMGASFSKLEPLIAASQQIQQAGASVPAGSGGGGASSGLLQLLLSQLTKSGGDSNPLGINLQQLIVESAVTGIREDLAFSRTVKRKILENMGVKVAEEVTGNIGKEQPKAEAGS